MSGGSYDYVCYRIRDIEIRDAIDNPRRLSFQKLLHLIADAMYAIEWVDSGDSSHGDDCEAIDKCFSFLGANPEMIKKAHAYDELKERLKKFFSEEEKN